MNSPLYRCWVRCFSGVFVCLILLLCPVVMGYTQNPTMDSEESYPSEEQSSDLSQKSFGPVVVRTVVSLVIVVGFIYVGIYFLKHFVYRRKAGGLSVRVVGSTLLGPKKGIYLVDVEDRRLVLGVTEHSISFLTELEAPSPDERLPASHMEERGESGGRFRGVLDSLMKKRGDDG